NPATGNLCSISYGRHLHLGFGTDRNIVINGYTVANLGLGQYYNYTNQGGGGGTCPSVSGVVRLYDAQNCGTPSIDAGLGLLQLEQNNFNDKAESIAIPSGWSARLYQNNNEN